MYPVHGVCEKLPEEGAVRGGGAPPRPLKKHFRSENDKFWHKNANKCLQTGKACAILLEESWKGRGSHVLLGAVYGA